MKKPMLIIAAACAAAACLGGCEACDGSSANKNEFEGLNTMLGLEYSSISLTVTDTFDENTFLSSKYLMNFTGDEVVVNYSVERFTDISLDTSAAVKTTLTGAAVIKDGAVTVVDGDGVDISADITGQGISFKDEYFENVEITGVYLIADVKNPSAFMGTDIVCTDMSVRATFLEFIYDIKITYTAEGGNTVEYKYIFEL